MGAVPQAVRHSGPTWPNRPELHKKKCAKRWRSLSKWPTDKQITPTVLRCRTASITRFIGATQLPTPFEHMLSMHRGGHLLCVAHTVNELLAHRLRWCWRLVAGQLIRLKLRA